MLGVALRAYLVLLLVAMASPLLLSHEAITLRGQGEFTRDRAGQLPGARGPYGFRGTYSPRGHRGRLYPDPDSTGDLAYAVSLRLGA